MWQILYTNIRGFRGKKHSLIEILEDTQPHLFLITETQMRSNISEKIDGYTLFSRVRDQKNGGGVAILVRDDIRNIITSQVPERNIELIWAIIQRKKKPPLFIGSYYGKQETRTNKNEIEREFQLLSEEIEEKSKDGEILLAMDANAKIGILNEEVSRNGKLLLDVIKRHNLEIINSSKKCTGRITRKNTAKSDEFSAIDFVIASQTAEKWISKMIIDEEGLLKVKGKKETDHNTISIKIAIENTEKIKPIKSIGWNIKAPSEKWTQFEENLKNNYEKASEIIMNNNLSMEERYNKWFHELDNAARQSIGKTTFKVRKKKKISKEICELQKEKLAVKNELKNETDKEKRYLLIGVYKQLQNKTKEEITKEQVQQTEAIFNTITNDKTGKTFWKVKKNLTRDPIIESLTVKNNEGVRQYTPEGIKETTAAYYENLYSKKEFPYHPYHDEVVYNNNYNVTQKQYDTQSYNQEPLLDEIIKIIQDKKNGKSAPDLKNEMLKKTGDTMIRFIHPLIKAIWNDEIIPSRWNTGAITSIWKGKGDREDLSNQRGITTSSAIGTIVDTLIDNRIARVVPFTEAQGGGKRGAMTADHLFILRAIICTSQKRKQETFITYYDVKKAYDNVDNADMLNIMWQKGLRGKTWRILKNLNEGLNANIKTRFGPTRTVKMEIGGKQGSRLTGRMFSKLMDTLAEDIEPTGEGFKIDETLTIGCLLWVDDVVSCVEGQNNQEKMLDRIADFAIKHKLRWGADKCKVMRVGKINNETQKWKLGSLEIEESDTYKYLGDVVTNDGKNAKNIETRKNKTFAATCGINSIAGTSVLRKIETKVILELHDKVILSALLTNAEAWTLNKSEKDEIERIEIQTLKMLFDLPIHTPTPAIIHTFGTLYTNLRIEKKRLMYLHRVINKRDTSWTKKVLLILERLNIGWAKSIKETLTDLNLPSDFSIIRSATKRQWKMAVNQKIEIKNRNRLFNDCHKTENNNLTRKTKTTHIVDNIEDEMYVRAPIPELSFCNKQETKTLITARFGMLECGKNFKGTMREMCNTCNVIDDEDHRLNYCERFKNINLFDTQPKVAFSDVFSTDMIIVRAIMKHIEKVWNVTTAHGNMNK